MFRFKTASLGFEASALRERPLWGHSRSEKYFLRGKAPQKMDLDFSRLRAQNLSRRRGLTVHET